MPKTIEVLEEALQNWEDYCLWNEVLWGDKPQDNPSPKKWRQFRNYLLNYQSGPVSKDYFSGMTNGPTEEMGNDLPYRTLPLQLLAWTIHSRRVFNLPEEMIDRFVSVSYDGLQWGDLLWPFDSFLVLIEGQRSGGGELKGFLVTHPLALVGDLLPEAIDLIQCRSLFQSANAAKLTHTDRRSLQEFARVKNPNPAKLLKKLKRLGSDSERIPFANLGAVEPIQFIPKGDIGRTIENAKPMVKMYLSILAGLCLYLEQLPAQVVESPQWKPYQPKVRDVRGLITSGAEVCDVGNFHTISPQTLTQALEKTNWPARSVTPHWRRAHYRRARGTGHDPNAPRTVLVKATLIHKDKVPPGALVGGSVSKLSLE